MQYDACADSNGKAGLFEHFPPTVLRFGARLGFFIIVRAGIVGRVNERNNRGGHGWIGHSGWAR